MTVIRNPFQTGMGKFKLHAAVIDRIATDVAAASAKLYDVTKVVGTNIHSTFGIYFHEGEIYLTTFDRFRFYDYGMGMMNRSDIPDFRAYFRSVFEGKFRAALDSTSVGGRYGFKIEDYSYDHNHRLNVTVWFTASGLTAW